jgi:hypothetical protein
MQDVSWDHPLDVEYRVGHALAQSTLYNQVAKYAQFIPRLLFFSRKLRGLLQSKIRAFFSLTRVSATRCSLRKLAPAELNRTIYFTVASYRG